LLEKDLEKIVKIEDGFIVARNLNCWWKLFLVKIFDYFAKTNGKKFHMQNSDF
jgi:hypothetical protein